MIPYMEPIHLNDVKIQFDAARVNTNVRPISEMYRMLSRMIDLFFNLLRSGDITNFIYDQKLLQSKNEPPIESLL